MPRRDARLASMRRMTTIGMLVAAVASNGAAQGGVPREPRVGSSERTAIVDAVRRSVGNATRYRIDFLRATARWAYFSGTEVVALDDPKGELQETDLSVHALLQRETNRRWRVVERWTLPGEDRAPRARFVDRVRLRAQRDTIPRLLFPPDLFP